METNITPFIIVAVFLVFNSCAEEPTPPNIIYILADDLGYGEIGAYGQEIIETPNIDALAKNGMLFTQHYSGSPVCAPSRSVLLTGLHTGHTYIRGNDEWKERGDVWNYEAVFNDQTLEGQRPLPDSIKTLAELIQDYGYKTAFVGKWGLGAPGTEGAPRKQGFNYFFGYNCQPYMNHKEKLFKSTFEVGIYLQIPLYGKTIEEISPNWLNLLTKCNCGIKGDNILLLNELHNWRTFFEARHSIPANALEKTRQLDTWSILTDTIVPPENFQKLLDK